MRQSLIFNLNLLIVISKFSSEMGVFGLWDILLTTAQKMNIDQLSGKILAIDASIWLVKADSVFS